MGAQPGRVGPWDLSPLQPGSSRTSGALVPIQGTPLAPCMDREASALRAQDPPALQTQAQAPNPPRMTSSEGRRRRGLSLTRESVVGLEVRACLIQLKASITYTGCHSRMSRPAWDKTLPGKVMFGLNEQTSSVSLSCCPDLEPGHRCRGAILSTMGLPTASAPPLAQTLGLGHVTMNSPSSPAPC